MCCFACCVSIVCMPRSQCQWLSVSCAHRINPQNGLSPHTCKAVRALRDVEAAHVGNRHAVGAPARFPAQTRLPTSSYSVARRSRVVEATNFRVIKTAATTRTSRRHARGQLCQLSGWFLGNSQKVLVARAKLRSCRASACPSTPWT